MRWDMSMRLIPVLLLLLAAVPFAADACPQGIPKGTPGCIPPNHPNLPANSGAATKPVYARWRDTWGALALDNATGFVGTATGERSKRAAEATAMNKCKTMGGGKCRVTLSYANQCAAMAYPPGPGGGKQLSQYNGSSRQEAEAGAVRQCATLNGEACEVTYSNCTEPVLVMP
jgi:hypothetical protein